MSNEILLAVIFAIGVPAVILLILSFVIYREMMAENEELELLGKFSQRNHECDLHEVKLENKTTR